MSALAHYLEEEGISTTVIALIRPHVEKARPPRALWVPFELGRPVGAPQRPGFQTDVIRAALALLHRNNGPVILEDYPHDEPEASDDPGWRAADLGGAKTILDEVAALKANYDKQVRATGRTTVGVSGLSIETAAAFVARIDSADPMPNPRRDLAEVQMLRFAVDDLKAFYLEAVDVGGTRPSSRQLYDWLWNETLLGKRVRAMRRASIEHPDNKRRLAAWWLVPDAWSTRTEVKQMREIDH